MASIRYVRLSDGETIEVESATLLSKFAPFKAVVIAEESVSPAWQAQVSAWLVDTGCLYTMAWGVDCAVWDTSVDLANLEKFDYDEVPNDQFVMTTWHEGKPLSEVFWFAKTAAHHPTVDIHHVLLVHISEEDRQSELEAEWKNAKSYTRRFRTSTYACHRYHIIM